MVFIEKQSCYYLLLSLNSIYFPIDRVCRLHFKVRSRSQNPTQNSYEQIKIYSKGEVILIESLGVAIAVDEIF
jgi:hypothetical protein